MSEQNLILKGIPASPGIVLGRARVLSDLGDFKASYRLVYTEEDKAAEVERFERAIDQAHDDLTRLKEKLEAEFPKHTHLLDLHLLILKDQMLYDEPLRFIKEGNLNAEWALYRSFERVRELFSRIEDPYIKGRIQDVESVYRRLLGNLMIMPVGKLYSFDLSKVDNTVPATPVTSDVKLNGWELGLAGNWTLGTDDLLLLGAQFAGNKVEQTVGASPTESLTRRSTRTCSWLSSRTSTRG